MCRVGASARGKSIKPKVLPFILDSNFYPSRILDLGSSIQHPTTKEEGELSFLFCGGKFLKIKNYFVFEKVQKFFLAN